MMSNLYVMGSCSALGQQQLQFYVLKTSTRLRKGFSEPACPHISSPACAAMPRGALPAWNIRIFAPTTFRLAVSLIKCFARRRSRERGGTCTVSPRNRMARWEKGALEGKAGMALTLGARVAESAFGQNITASKAGGCPHQHVPLRGLRTVVGRHQACCSPCKGANARAAIER